MKKLLPLVYLVFLSGCASIVSGGPEVVTISSNPPAAKMTLCNDRTGQCMAVGQTPYTATLERGQGYFKPARYSIKCEKEGYGLAERTLSAGMNGWYAGNIIFGGLIGILIVDPATGAMWDIKENNLVLNLSPMAKASEVPEIVPDSAVIREEEQEQI